MAGSGAASGTSRGGTRTDRGGAKTPIVSHILLMTLYATQVSVFFAVLLDFLFAIVGPCRQVLQDFLLIGDQLGGSLAKLLRHRVQRLRRRDDKRKDQD